MLADSRPTLQNSPPPLADSGPQLARSRPVLQASSRVEISDFASITRPNRGSITGLPRTSSPVRGDAKRHVYALYQPGNQ
jgi:hypothetical protein